jgi:dihydroorotate dehydrogenase electron transfer subunit
MLTEQATVIYHKKLSKDYSMLRFVSPEISAQSQPGQFVHIRIPTIESTALRRPFGIFKAYNEQIEIVYCKVGYGTNAMDKLTPGTPVNILGPLGNGFPKPKNKTFPVLIAGGYGIAALYLLAERASSKGVVFIGGACKTDILCTESFKNTGFGLYTASEDGSTGYKGMVTDALDRWVKEELSDRKPEIFACGPDSMLKAVTLRAKRRGWTAWLAMDRHMCCGIGACLSCIQKVYTKPPQKESIITEKDELALRSADWKYARVCTDGPVFECREIIWGK